MFKNCGLFKPARLVFHDGPGGRRSFGYRDSRVELEPVVAATVVAGYLLFGNSSDTSESTKGSEQPVLRDTRAHVAAVLPAGSYASDANPDLKNVFFVPNEDEVCGQ